MNTSRQLMEPVASTALDSKPGTASVSLREVLDRQTPGRMPTSVGVQIILAAGEVLARAHERGSGLHGNLDPNCVDVDHLGAVRVRGFGEGIGSRRLSPYQAPELRRGEVADDLADVYSLAALLYEVITGYSSLQAAAREPCLGAEPVPRPSRLTSNVGAEFDVLMLRALALDPSDRPASVRALLNELRLMLRSMEIEATQAGLKAYVDEQLPWLAVRASGRIATPPPRPATPGPVLSMPAPPPSDPGQMPALVFGPNGLPVPPEGSALPQAAELGVAQVSGGSRRAVAADSRVSRRDFDAGVAPLSGRSRRAPDPVFVPVESAVDPISRPRLRASGSFRKTPPTTSLVAKKQSARRRRSKVRGKFDHAAFDETDQHLPTSAETAPAPIWAKLRWLFIRDVELRIRQVVLRAGYQSERALSRLPFRDRLAWIIFLGSAVVVLLGLLAVL